MAKYAKIASEADSGLLDWLNAGLQPSYRHANWLLTNYDAVIWDVALSNEPRRINWEVFLDDGTLLTAPKNNNLLRIFKSWLCVQDHAHLTGGKIFAPESIARKVKRVAQLIDFFLLRADTFKLGEHGLLLVTESDIRNLYATIASTPYVAQTIYDIDNRLRRHLWGLASKLSNAEVQQAIIERPAISDLCATTERVLFLSDTELLCVRAYLHVAGHYGIPRRVPSNPGMDNYDQLIETLLQNTIWARHTGKMEYDELALIARDSYFREYEGVPVRTSDNRRMGAASLSLWQHSLRSLELLAHDNLPIPTNALMNASSSDLFENLELSDIGRFRTLPTEWSFNALRKSIEFCLDYGKDLLQSYLNLALAVSKSNQSLIRFIETTPIEPYLTPKIRSLGVKVWNLRYEMGFVRMKNSKNNRMPISSPKIYFQRLRDNQGLFELIQILFGAIQFCIGILSARRVNELRMLKNGKALNTSRTSLKFSNMKTGFYGMRVETSRPIPPIVETLISLVEQFQHDLSKFGLIEATPFLLARPCALSLEISNSIHAYNAALDLFSDYFEAPLESNNRRHYVRHHQLRRAFAMLFFWNKLYPGLSTLSWFLGHMDPEQAYRYATESTPGDVLSWQKANYGAHLLQQETKSSEALADLIELHFGTRNFSVLDFEELEEYIHVLLEEGNVSIEPHFFSTPSGKDYEIVIHAKRS